jgi:hypothetical protein
LTPTSPEKPALVGGIPTGSPKIQVGSEDVRVGGFVIAPQGTIEANIPKLAGLAPLSSLAGSQLSATSSLGSGAALTDVDKISTPTAVKPLEAAGLQPSTTSLGAVSQSVFSPSLIPPVMVPSAIVPTFEQASLGAVPTLATSVPLPPPLEIDNEQAVDAGSDKNSE